MNDITPVKAGEIIEAVIARGDIAQLSPQERAKYYVRVCESVGLNPMTRPFEYITLNGKLTLYARKDCTDQLRAIHGVSVYDLTESERDNVFIVTAKVENASGRKDASKGAVNIGGLKGEALANALMKAETKAKRRATLSICGLGFLDETEAETIPDAHIGADSASYPEPPKPPKEVSGPKSHIERPGAPAERAEDLNEIDPAAGAPKFLTRSVPAPPSDMEAKVDPSPPAPPVRRGPGRPPKTETRPASTPLAPKPEKIDEAQWLRDLEGAASGAMDLERLAEVQQKVQVPMRSKVSAEAWVRGKKIVLGRSAEIFAAAEEE